MVRQAPARGSVPLVPPLHSEVPDVPSEPPPPPVTSGPRPRSQTPSTAAANPPSNAVLVRASGGATNYEVHTPNAVAAVRGTRFDTAYSEGAVRPFYDGCSRYTDVSVYDGTVNLASNAAPNAGEDVGAGYEATVPCQQSPVPAGPLAMTGAASMGAASATSGFSGSMPGASGAPSPA